MSRVKFQSPLNWPVTRKRTPAATRKRSPFADARHRALRAVRDELERLGVMHGTITSGLAQGNSNDLPLASAREPDDPGVAVYYTYKGRDHYIACDTYRTAGANLVAIAKTIEAQRGIVRWGCLSVEEAIAGSRLALPGETSAPRPWREVLGLEDPKFAVLEAPDLYTLAKVRHRKMMATDHPDKGGNVAAAAELNAAIEMARTELLGEEAPT